MVNIFKYPFKIYFGSAILLLLFTSLYALLFPNISLILQQTLLGNILPSFICSGFLITAMPSWNNFKGNITTFAISLYILLIITFFLAFIHLNTSVIFLTISWLYLFIFSAYLMWRDKNMDNLNLLAIIFLIFIIQIVYSYSPSIQYLLSLIAAYVASTVLVLFKISIMMGNEALKVTTLKNPIFIPNKIYRNLLASLLFIYCITNIYLNVTVNGFIALGIGSLFIAKLKELHYRELLTQPYIKTYYFVQVINGISFLYLGVMQTTQQNIENAFSLLLISASLTSLCFMMLIIALRHCDINNLRIKDKHIYTIILLFSIAGFPYIFNLNIIYQQIISLLLLSLASLLFLNAFIPIFLQHSQKKINLIRQRIDK